MKILYLHGFNSGANSETVKLLQAAMPQDEIISFDLPLYNPFAVFQKLSDFFINYVATSGKKELVIVGTSTGGFFAELMHLLYGFPAVLINPARHPSAQLKKYLGVNTNYATGKSEKFTEKALKEYELFETFLIPPRSNYVPLTCLLYEGDDLINANITYNEVNTYCEVKMFQGGGHRITKAEIPDVVAAIIDTANVVIGEMDD